MNKNIFHKIILSIACWLGITASVFAIPVTQAVLDQNNPGTDCDITITTAWQSFMPQVTGELTQIDILQDINQIPNVTFTIYSGEGTDGTELYSVSNYTPTFYGWYAQYTLSSPIYVTQGRHYTFQITIENPLEVTIGNAYKDGASLVGPTISDLSFQTWVEPIVFPANDNGPIVEQVNTFKGSFQFEQSLGRVTNASLAFDLSAAYTNRYFDMPTDSVLGLGWQLNIPQIVKVDNTYYTWLNGQYSELLLSAANSSYDTYRAKDYDFSIYQQSKQTSYQWKKIDPNGNVWTFGNNTTYPNSVVINGSNIIYSPGSLTDLAQRTITFQYANNTAQYPFSLQKSALLTSIQGGQQALNLTYDSEGYLTTIQKTAKSLWTAGTTAPLEVYTVDISNTDTVNIGSTAYRTFRSIGQKNTFGIALVPPIQYTYASTRTYAGQMTAMTVPESEDIYLTYKTITVQSDQGPLSQPVVDTVLLDHGFGTSSTYYDYPTNASASGDYHYPMFPTADVSDSTSLATGYTQYTMISPSQNQNASYSQNDLLILEGFTSKITSYATIDNNGTQSQLLSSTETLNWDVLSNQYGSYRNYYPRIQSSEQRMYYPDTGTTTYNIKSTTYTYNSSNGLTATVNQSIGGLPAANSISYMEYAIDDPVISTSLQTLNYITPINKVTETLGNSQRITTINWQAWSSTMWAPSLISTIENSNNQTGIERNYQITQRTSSGEIINEIDNQNRSQSYIYADQNRFAIAKADLAADGDWTYAGFEPYETGLQATNEPTAHTGTGILKSSSSAITQDLTVSFPGATGYRISAWYKLSNGGSVTLGLGQNLTKTITTQSSDWTYASYIASPANTDSPFVTVTNGSVDDITIVPVGSQVTSYVYNPTLNIQTAELVGNQTAYYFYDTLGNPVTSLSNNNALGTLSSTYISAATDTQVPTPDLSTQLTWQFQNSGTIARASNSFTPWQLLNGAEIDGHYVVLNQDTTSGSWSTLSQMQTEIPTTSYVAHAQLGQLTNDIALEVGNTVYQWQDGTWSLIQNNVTQPIAQQTVTPSTLTLYNSGSSAMLIANGRIITTESIPTPSGYISIMAPSNSNVNVTYVAIGKTPQAEAAFYNTAGDVKQLQALVTNKKTQASEYLLDNYGRLDTITKPLFYDSLFKFQTDLVTSYNRTSGVMLGDVSTYYPNDNNQPYQRRYWDNSPDARPVKQQLPGTIANAFESLYYENTNISQVGADQFQGLGPATTVTQNIFSNQPLGYSLGGTPYLDIDYSESNVPETLQWPNLAINLERNANQQITSVTLPDTTYPVGTIYDSYGRPVFTGPTNGSGSIRYIRYDVLDRITEAGLYTQSWNETTLQQLANQMETPGYTNPDLSWKRRYDYPSTDNAPLGQLATVSANNTGSVIEETYTYDNIGRVTRTAFYVPGYNNNAPYITEYSYDNLSNMTELAFQLNDVTANIVYSYNALGQITSIGDQSLDYTYGSYIYNALGNISQRSLNHNTVTQTMDFDSLGNITSMDSEYVTLAYDYLNNQGALQQGWLQTMSVSYNPTAQWLTPPPSDSSTAYTYDSKGQLTNATSTPQSDSTFTYDANGNITSIQHNGQTAPYTYIPNTNKVDTAVLNGLSTSFAYTSQGAVSGYTNTSQSYTLTYDPFTQRPSSIELTNLQNNTTTTNTLSYGPNNQRYLKTTSQTTDTTTLYLHGLQPYPYSEITWENGTPTQTAYIYGPDGLIATLQSSGISPILKDSLGSARVIINPAGTIAASYDYTPFGTPIINGSSSLNYLFTGQEWDSEINLYNYQARMYDPELARFLSIDPQINGPSPYVFVKNNPLTFTDPTGEVPERLTEWGNGHHLVTLQMQRSHGAYFPTQIFNNRRTPRFYPYPPDSQYNIYYAGRRHQNIHDQIGFVFTQAVTPYFQLAYMRETLANAVDDNGNEIRGQLRNMNRNNNVVRIADNVTPLQAFELELVWAFTEFNWQPPEDFQLIDPAIVEQLAPNLGQLYRLRLQLNELIAAPTIISNSNITDNGGAIQQLTQQLDNNLELLLRDTTPRPHMMVMPVNQEGMYDH